jgi:hypothetical protein
MFSARSASIFASERRSSVVNELSLTWNGRRSLVNTVTTPAE